jgi:Leucine-rich repeat (LRR) protein
MTITKEYYDYNGVLQTIYETTLTLEEIIQNSYAYDINDNYIENISDIDKISKVNVNGLNLIEIPKDLLKCKNLEYLYVANNKITNWDILENNKTLYHLDCSDNNLRTIPKSLENTQIRTLVINKNKIKKLENLPKKINSLYISDNLIYSICNLKKYINLNVLKMNNNKMKNLNFLRNIAEFLTSIDISNNEIKKIPDLSFLERIKIIANNNFHYSVMNKNEIDKILELETNKNIDFLNDIYNDLLFKKKKERRNILKNRFFNKNKEKIININNNINDDLNISF